MTTPSVQGNGRDTLNRLCDNGCGTLLPRRGAIKVGKGSEYRATVCDEACALNFMEKQLEQRLAATTPPPGYVPPAPPE